MPSTFQIGKAQVRMGKKVLIIILKLVEIAKYQKANIRNTES